MDTDTTRTTLSLPPIKDWEKWEFSVKSALLADGSGRDLITHLQNNTTPEDAKQKRLDEKLYAAIVSMLNNSSGPKVEVMISALQADTDNFGKGTKAVHTLRNAWRPGEDKARALKQLMTTRPRSTNSDDTRGWLTEFQMIATRSGQDDTLLIQLLTDAITRNELGANACMALQAWRLQTDKTSAKLIELLTQNACDAANAEATGPAQYPAIAYHTDAHNRGNGAGSGPCMRCGKANHLARDCKTPKENMHCKSCGKSGHVAEVCLGGKGKGKGKGKGGGLCRLFQAGNCKYGDWCKFQHAPINTDNGEQDEAKDAHATLHFAFNAIATRAQETSTKPRAPTNTSRAALRPALIDSACSKHVVPHQGGTYKHKQTYEVETPNGKVAAGATRVLIQGQERSALALDNCSRPLLSVPQLNREDGIGYICKRGNDGTTEHYLVMPGGDIAIPDHAVKLDTTATGIPVLSRDHHEHTINGQTHAAKPKINYQYSIKRKRDKVTNQPHKPEGHTQAPKQNFSNNAMRTGDKVKTGKQEPGGKLEAMEDPIEGDPFLIHKDIDAMYDSNWTGHFAFASDAHERAQCKYFARGKCMRGKKCPYAHDATLSGRTRSRSPLERRFMAKRTRRDSRDDESSLSPHEPRLKAKRSRRDSRDGNRKHTHERAHGPTDRDKKSCKARRTRDGAEDELLRELHDAQREATKWKERYNETRQEAKRIEERVEDLEDNQSELLERLRILEKAVART